MRKLSGSFGPLLKSYTLSGRCKHLKTPKSNSRRVLLAVPWAVAPKTLWVFVPNHQNILTNPTAVARTPNIIWGTNPEFFGSAGQVQIAPTLAAGMRNGMTPN